MSLHFPNVFTGKLPTLYPYRPIRSDFTMNSTPTSYSISKGPSMTPFPCAVSRFVSPHFFVLLKFVRIRQYIPTSFVVIFPYVPGLEPSVTYRMILSS